ncbi:hypothetical protein [Spirosoma pomorum]
MKNFQSLYTTKDRNVTKRLIVLLAALTSLSTSACRKPFCEDHSDQVSGEALRYIQKLPVPSDENGGDLGMYGIRISDNQQYQKVFRTYAGVTLDSIDFSKYELLGLSTVNRGSRSSYIRDVKKDDTNKVITYTVTEEYCVRSSPVEGNSNIVLINKLPLNYRVEYKRNQ